MTQAPPTVPGIPAANSNPVRPHFKARLAALESSTPEPARRISPSVSSRSNRLVLTMRPGYPWSLTRRLLPFPTMYQGSPAFWKRETRAPSSSAVSGSAYQAAGPPARNEVCIFIGSLILISMKPPVSSFWPGSPGPGYKALWPHCSPFFSGGS